MAACLLLLDRVASLISYYLPTYYTYKNWKIAKMFYLQPLKLCKDFVDELNRSLSQIGSNRLTTAQKFWLSVCITGIIITNSVCWKKFERAGLGRFCANTLSKMFRRSKIYWDQLLMASVLNLFESYNITKGLLAVDGTDNPRSKNTSKIAKVHKVKDKKTGGFMQAQEIAFLILITDKLTIPVGFEFYEPDPNYRAWKEKDKALKKLGTAKKDRPEKPELNSQYPTQIQVALNLLKNFETNYPQITISAILADALYGAKNFVKPASQLFGGTQVVSQVKKNQKVKYFKQYISVEEYFKRNPGVERRIQIRGGKTETVMMHGARLYLKAHGCKRYIIALKYEGESNYRYLMASDLTWRLTDIAEAYSLRWLVEVFIQDWKSYEGWCQLAKQPDVDGSCRGVLLSLLVDHCLLLHPEQKALVNNKLPASTVGSLRDRERANAVVESIESLISGDDASEIITSLKDCVNKVIPLQPSKKHMSSRTLGRLEATPSLQYHVAA